MSPFIMKLCSGIAFDSFALCRGDEFEAVQAEFAHEVVPVAAVLADVLAQEPRGHLEHRVRALGRALQQRLGLAARYAGAHELAQRRVIGPAHGVAAGEVLRRVQAQADDGYARRLEYGQNARADAHGVLHRVLCVFSSPPEVTERRVAHYDRRVDTDAVRLQGRYAPGGLDVGLVVRAGQAGHHLQYEPEARGLDRAGGRHNVLRRVAAAREGQDAL